MAEKRWLGIDVGTTAIKAAVYKPNGSLVSLGQVPSPVQSAPGGVSEQDMGQVLQGVYDAICDALTDQDAAQIECIGIAAQGDGFWGLTEGGQPSGPAILWNDTRAANVIKALSADQQGAVSRACHTSIWPGTSGAIYNWLKTHAPEQAERTHYIVHCAGWVGYCLTGEMAVDFSDATIPFLDLSTGAYSDEALAALGAEDLRRKLLSPRAAGSALGGISADAAAATGLCEGTPVSVGTLDLSAMIVGMGMDQPGDTMMILGTTAVVNILTDSVEPISQPVGATAFHANGKLLTRIFAPTTGAAAFDWFCALHPYSLGGDSPGEIAGKLNALAQEVPPGANGVTFMPYLNGERAPFVSPEASGSFFGLTTATTKAEMGRSVMEGTAFSLRHCYVSEREQLPTTPIRLTGGGSKNALWCQIISDVMQAPIEVSATSAHGLWGAACLGAAATGKGDACVLASRDDDTTTYQPNRNHAAAYAAAFDRYLTLSQACRALWDA